MPVAQCVCGARYKVPEGSAGRKARCKKCGRIFQIPDREDGPIPLADEPDLAGLVRAEAAAPPAETASGSMFEQAAVSTAYDPDAAPRVDHLPRIRPRTGFWSDVGWTLLFFISPQNLVMFLVVWLLSMGTQYAVFVPIFGWLAVVIINMYIVAWYMSIIAETASGEDDLPRMSTSGGWWDDVIRPNLEYYGTFLLMLAPGLVYAIFIAKTLQGSGLVGPGGFNLYNVVTSGGGAVLPLLVLVVIGLFLWPIALMCVSMGGLSALFRVDLILVAVAKTFLAYTAIFVMVAAATFLPSILLVAATSAGGGLTPSGLPLRILAPALRVYFSIVAMRLIGLYYRHFKERFPWDWE
ncbi:MAG: hypothetical protein V2A79_11490 [Planctomycetota bacterium]